MWDEIWWKLLSPLSLVKPNLFLKVIISSKLTFCSIIMKDRRIRQWILICRTRKRVKTPDFETKIMWKWHFSWSAYILSAVCENLILFEKPTWLTFCFPLATFPFPFPFFIERFRKEKKRKKTSTKCEVNFVELLGFVSNPDNLYSSFVSLWSFSPPSDQKQVFMIKIILQRTSWENGWKRRKKPSQVSQS